MTFKKSSVCPNCQGYAGAYKKENRCKGFVHQDGEVFFCQVANDTKPISPLGFNLYRYACKDFEFIDYKEMQ